jgi:hypothetical protein
MKPIQFGYISPIDYLDVIPSESRFHLILAHLLGNKKYVDYYNEKYNRGDYIILDNSAFEFKRPIEADELLNIIELSGINVSCVVAPDYPFKRGIETVRSAVKFVKRFNDDVDILAVPQSETGDVEDWLDCYYELQQISNVTHIGMSILGVPNAFCSITGTKDIMINRIWAAQYITHYKLNNPRIRHHFLGLGQPREILLQRQIGLIDSNDSSSPIWHGINGITYDDSMGGLINGKIDAPVEFDLITTSKDKKRQMKDIIFNINFIKKICGE